ncbi:hypothetical protein ACFQV2_10785 [Actinokineospora soli]|uniref:Uncharacterized protein n=1 Tax=Actinokineospora soli TaxID=1048753 RepID=A0ABW2TN57_9PSEU
MTSGEAAARSANSGWPSRATRQVLPSRWARNSQPSGILSVPGTPSATAVPNAQSPSARVTVIFFLACCGIFAATAASGPGAAAVVGANRTPAARTEAVNRGRRKAGDTLDLL